jgi:hypothetical protein
VVTALEPARLLAITSSHIMAGLDPAIHVLLIGLMRIKTWMPGTRPGMT